MIYLVKSGYSNAYVYAQSVAEAGNLFLAEMLRDVEEPDEEYRAGVEPTSVELVTDEVLGLPAIDLAGDDDS